MQALRHLNFSLHLYNLFLKVFRIEFIFYTYKYGYKIFKHCESEWRQQGKKATYLPGLEFFPGLEFRNFLRSEFII